MGTWTPGPGPTGGDDVFVGDGTDETASAGAGTDTLSGNGGNDILNGGDGDDTINGGDGNDILAGETAIAVDTVSTGNDTLNGGDGDDYLIGGMGNDILNGGDGRDTLYNYVVLMTSPGSASFPNFSYSSGTDTFDGGVGQDTGNFRFFDRTSPINVVFNASNVVTQILVNGVAGGSFVNIEYVNIDSGAGNDVFNLSGFDGAGSINGFDGDDTITGSALGDSLSGGAGQDEIHGGDGNDFIRGGAGADILDGGNGRDTLSYEGSSTAVDVNLALQTATGGEAEGDTISNFEEVYGTSQGDTLIGSNADETLYGRQGDDHLYGGGGNDNLGGEQGVDEMFGGTGDDLYSVTDATDTVTEYADEGTDRVLVYSIASYTLTDNVEHLNYQDNSTFTGTGNALANTMTANTGAQTLLGMGGNDILFGGLGDDTLDGGADNDTASYLSIYHNLIGGVTVSLAISGAQNTGNFGFDTLINIENLSGTNVSDTLTGDGGANILSGLSGDDTLDGGAGVDTLIGGDGNDEFRVFASNAVGETLNGGNDIDTIRMAGSVDFTTYTLTALERLAFAGETGLETSLTATFASNNLPITQVAGSSVADRLRVVADSLGGIVDLSAWTFSSWSASDQVVFVGGAGEDRFIGHSGADVMYANSAHDSVDGRGGDDFIVSAGNVAQALIGGSGFNTLVVAKGALINAPGNAFDGYYQSDFTGLQIGGINALDFGAPAGIDNDTNVDKVFVVSTAQLTQTSTFSPILTVRGADGRSDVIQITMSGLGNISLESWTFNSWNSNGSGGNPNERDLIVIRGNESQNQLAGSSQIDWLFGGDNNDTLAGGLGNDILNGEAGNDLLIGGEGADAINGGDGNDTVQYDTAVTLNLATGTASGADATGDVLSSIENATGSAFDDILVGDSGANVLIGNEGADTLEGDAGDDILRGGAGADTLRGGDGVDTLAYTGADSVNVNLATGAASGSDAAGDTFTSIENISGSGFGDTLTGDAGVNRLSGLAGNDIIDGGAGNDFIDGGTGADTMIGGDGDDTYDADNLGDVVTELALGGVDLVRTTVNNYVLAANVENLLLLGQAFNGSGNAGDNVITGNNFNNTLSGGDGNDTLIGGLGADTLIGGLGDDTYEVDNAGDVVTEALSEGIDTVRTYTASYVIGTNIENLTLMGSLITGAGNDLYNIITGNAQNNLLFGGIGNDTLIGGDGADHLYGGVGVDVLNGGDGYDYARYDNAAARVIADTVLGGAGGEGAGDTFFSIEGLVGSAFNDFLSGGDVDNDIHGNAGADVIQGRGGNDYLGGGDGADHLYGGAGIDTLDGGAGFDYARYDDATGRVVADTVLGGAGGEGAGDTFISIEGLVGSAFNDFLSGGDVDNDIQGGAGADVIQGRGGNDNLGGGDGADHLYGGAGVDTLDGGAGYDYARYDDATGRVVADTVLGGAGGDGAGDTFISIEGLVGSAFNDFLSGSDIENDIHGLSGNDVIQGRGGNDNLGGEDGADHLFGGAGADTLDGGAGFDYVRYDDSPGAVTVNLATGGTGSDAQGDVFTSIEGVLGSAFNDTLTGTNEINDMYGGAGADTLFGLGGGDALTGDAGADRLDGGAGADILTGGADADTFVFVAGQANGDTVVDFSLSGGDLLEFSGYGTAAQGATFVQLDATHWQITSANGLIVETLTVSNGVVFDSSDYVFGP